MDLSPYRENNSSVFRSRSSSFSSPTSRNFLYQEVFEIGGNTLVRSYSCGQVFGKDGNGQTIQSTQVRILNLISPAKSFVEREIGINQKSFSDPKKFPVKSCKRIPLKAKMSLQFPDDDKIKECNVKTEQSTSKKLTFLIWRNMKRTVYVNLVILSILLACYLYRFTYCNQQWDTRVTVNNLKKSVFGQESVIFEIETILTNFGNSSESVVMCFIGSGGVGKTFVSSIIHESFPWVSNKYIYYFDTMTEEILKTKKYSSCGVNLIVIDGIHESNAEPAFQYVKYLIDENDSAKFLVILIFQNNSKDRGKFLSFKMKNEDRRYYYILFRDLKEQDIEKCLTVELQRQKKYISHEKLNNLVTDNMKFCNISNSFLGCKNIYHEVSGLPGND